jgi:hypothetical protein
MKTTNREFGAEGFDSFALILDTQDDPARLAAERLAAEKAAADLEARQLTLFPNQP